MHDDGVIKFDCRWVKKPARLPAGAEELMLCRNELFKRGFIGVYEDGTGYGNISMRETGSRHFLISGTQTGRFEKLSQEYYTLVTGYNIEQNRLECQGLVKASSESLTHAMIYELDEEIGAVVHVHHAGMWDRLKDHIPTTCESIAYGTPEMALEVKRLYAETNLKTEKIFAMAGHEHGLISFGAVPDEACRIILNA